MTKSKSKPPVEQGLSAEQLKQREQEQQSHDQKLADADKQDATDQATREAQLAAKTADQVQPAGHDLPTAQTPTPHEVVPESDPRLAPEQPKPTVVENPQPDPKAPEQPGSQKVLT